MNNETIRFTLSITPDIAQKAERSRRTHFMISLTLKCTVNLFSLAWRNWKKKRQRRASVNGVRKSIMNSEKLHIVSWSGGKDSTATIILAHELGLPIDLIIMSVVWFDKSRGLAITADDEVTEELIAHLLKQVNFYIRGNNLIETAFALGGGFFIQFWDGTKTAQKYITQDFIYPISYSGRLTEAAFASSKVIDGKRYTYLETHLLDEKGEYVIDNSLLYSDTKDGHLREVSASFYEEHGIEPKVETHRTSHSIRIPRSWRLLGGASFARKNDKRQHICHANNKLIKL